MTTEERIAQALRGHAAMEARLRNASSDEMANGSAYPYMVHNFAFAALLEVLRRDNPQLAEAAGEWIQSALDDGDTASEVAMAWREDVALGQPLWFPESVLTHLPPSA